MATNIVTTVNDVPGTLELDGGKFRDELLNFAGAATVKKGTILARITASGKLTPYVIGGSLGAGVPVAILTFDVARASAGDEAIRALVAGAVNKNRLIVQADGNGSNITNAILDQLRAEGIVPIDVASI
jgi:hypothetical protein